MRTVDVARRAERRERDRERFAGGIAGDPLGEFERALQRLRRGRPRSARVRPSSAKRSSRAIASRRFARPNGGPRPGERGALGRGHDLGAPARIGFEEQRRLLQARRPAIEQRLGQPSIQRSLDALFGAAGERGIKPRIDGGAAVSRERDEDFDFVVIGEHADEFGVEVVAPRDRAGARIVARGGGEQPLARQRDRALQNMERGLAAEGFEGREDVGGLGAGREFARDRASASHRRRP